MLVALGGNGVAALGGSVPIPFGGTVGSVPGAVIEEDVAVPGCGVLVSKDSNALGSKVGRGVLVALSSLAAAVLQPATAITKSKLTMPTMILARSLCLVIFEKLIRMVYLSSLR